MANAQPLSIVTPLGRIVQGHPMEGQTKDQKGNPYLYKSGANKGQQATKYFVALAIPKIVTLNGQNVENPEWAQFYAALYNAARQAWPQFFQGPNGACTNPNFSWKITDGDGYDQEGKPHSAKEGFAGHWVVKASSMYAPKCFKFGNFGPGQQLVNVQEIKRGDYGRMAISYEDNTGAERAGMYMNLDMFELLGYGQEIRTGPDAAATFGAVQHSAYSMPGMSSTPVAPAAQAGLPPLPGAGAATTPPPPMTNAPAMGTTPPPMTNAPAMGAGMAPPPMTGAPAMGAGMTPPPNHQFVNNVAAGAVPAQGGGIPMPMPGQGAATPPPMTQPQYVMTAAAQGYTREQYHAQGVTDEQLLAHGYMQRIG